MTHTHNFRRLLLLMLCLGLTGGAISYADQNLAGNVTITGGAAAGKLNVTGAIDSDSNTFTFGTQSSSYGAGLLYLDNAVDTLSFSINRNPASWLWVHNATIAAMRLDSAHQLILYRDNGTTAGITLTPGTVAAPTSTLALGTATLSGTGGALTATGNMNFTGADGSLSLSSSGVALSAVGAGKNITFTTPVSGGGDIVFNTNGLERARINSSGNIGIGTNNPLFKLDVLNNNYNAIRASGNSTNSVGIYIQNLTASGRQWALLSAGGGAAGGVGSFSIWDDTVGAGNRFNITPAGNVGIGTINPAATLTVRSGIASSLQLSRAANPNVQLIDDGTASVGQIYYDSSRIMHLGTSGGSDALTLNLATGNVGVGTTSPSARLDVAGKLHSGSGTDNVASTINGLSVQDSAGNPVSIAAGKSTSRSTGLVWYDNGASGSAVLYTYGNAAPLSIAASNLDFVTAAGTAMAVNSTGNVGIGTTNPGTYKLAVNGSIHAKEIVVDTSGWSDYVFDQDYRLAPLSEVESHIKTEKHLPGIPSAAKVAEHGVSLGDMQSKLLAKVEELTLHLIAQEKEIAALRRQVGEIKAGSNNR